ncbi:hypothetical protein PVAND_001089 [Polypedilum vanderplanki]|uniref:Cytochrome P450 n=1 Tax=Polypedilum vanderplanki TaxID=319348 RepID=A0A9J6BMH4_POLVA|nr:hypothetical protein PVAND_001089 [Polypedilum vanderplanki]
MILEILLSIFFIFLLSLYRHFKRNYEFWRNRQIPFLQPTFPVGNMMEAVKTKQHFGFVMEDIYQHMKKRSDVGDYCGIFFFHQPVLLVMTPEFAKTVLVRDFNYFADRGVYSNEEVDTLSGNLFFLEGPRWRFLRQKLAPTFTSGKLKSMFPIILDVGQKFVEHLKPYGEKNMEIEIYDLLARFLTDIISSCAFGFDSNSLENPDNEFRTISQKGLNLSKFKSLKCFLSMVFREKARKFGLRFFDEEINDYFSNLVETTIANRKKSGIKRKDFLELLINLMEKDDENGEKLNIKEVTAQAFIFMIAGFETSSTNLSYALHLLAYHQDIQDKARKSIDKKLNEFDNQWSYDAIMEMTYLEQIIEESLRIHPPIATLHRITTKEYTLPNGKTIPENTGVIIPNLAYQRDPEHFPDPLKFDPERFNAENKNSRHQFTYLPFGDGPRFCIGMRFGQLQSRLGLALLLKNFKFEPCDKTENPIEIHPIKLIYAPKNGMYLRIKKI